jgi:SAM-dependent methyltransferase
VTAGVPERIRWAVELLDVHPDDAILEFGCGPGVAARLVADQLVAGRGWLLAIDRSATAIDRARRRNTDHIEAGRVLMEHAALADLNQEPDQFDKAFGVNVNVFWTSPAGAELAVLARVLRPGGAVYLAYEGPSGGTTRDVTPDLAANLRRHGFAPEVVGSGDGRKVCIIGRQAAA